MAELWNDYLWPTVWTVILIVVMVVPILLSVAYLTYAERKIIGAMQLRQGPIVFGPLGLLQPLADGLKLLVKETVLPSGANKVVFLLAPMVTFILALIGWAVIPFGDGLVIADINAGRGTLGKLIRDEQIYNDARAAIEAARPADTLDARARASATPDRLLTADVPFLPRAHPFRWSLGALRLREWQPTPPAPQSSKPPRLPASPP